MPRNLHLPNSTSAPASWRTRRDQDRAVQKAGSEMDLRTGSLSTRSVRRAPARVRGGARSFAQGSHANTAPGEDWGEGAGRAAGAGAALAGSPPSVVIETDSVVWPVEEGGVEPRLLTSRID